MSLGRLDACAPVPDSALDDDRVAGATQLTEEVIDLLSAVTLPSTIVPGSWRPTQAMYRPGKRLTVVHSIVTESPDGVHSHQSLVTDSRVPTQLHGPDTATVSNGNTEICVWALPADPRLPGLRPVLDPDQNRDLAAGLGLSGPVTSTLRSYRPGRRAVVELSDDRHAVYIKVVEPRRIAKLQKLHEVLGDQAGVARTLGWSPEQGYIVLEAVPGTVLSDAIHLGVLLPDGAALRRSLECLPPLETALVPLRDRLGPQLSLVQSLLPSRANETEEFVELVSAPIDDPYVSVHGDFHSGQVMTDYGGVVGLVDVDRAGLGHHVDDLAMMLAHLHVLALGDSSGRTANYLSRLYSDFCAASHPPTLHDRTAAALFGFVPGGFTSQSEDWISTAHARMDAAQQWALGPAFAPC